MNIQSDLDISVISLNTHRCSPWDPKGVWHAQESKQSKLGKVFWVQRHGGKYRDACEEWSSVKLGLGGIFLLVFVSVPLLIIRWEFNLLLPSELLELHFRFQFYSQVWGSRDCGSNWILVGYCRYCIVPQRDSITSSESMRIPSALLLLLSSPIFFQMFTPLSFLIQDLLSPLPQWVACFAPVLPVCEFIVCWLARHQFWGDRWGRLQSRQLLPSLNDILISTETWQREKLLTGMTGSFVFSLKALIDDFWPQSKKKIKENRGRKSH